MFDNYLRFLELCTTNILAEMTVEQARFCKMRVKTPVTVLDVTELQEVLFVTHHHINRTPVSRTGVGFS